ncbi:hypothetical protein ABBQ38_009625 [Trebouxia sp. C0009 RCD-2024]
MRAISNNGSIGGRATGTRLAVRATVHVAPSEPQHVTHKPASFINAKVNYIQPSAHGEELYAYLYEKPESVSKVTNLEHVEIEVPMTDLRTIEDKKGRFTLHDNGFQLEQLHVPSDIDWTNNAEVAARYYPRVADLLKRVAGASRVHIFDHTIRMGSARSVKAAQADPDPRGKPVSRVHVDYTVKSGPERLQAVLPDEAERLMKTPFAVIQVWRPLRGPVDESPLGMIDASSVAKEDLLPYTLHFPGRTGYNYAAKHNPEHRWYYAKGINTDEAYVFVCYDSRDGRARFTPHTGFKDPTTSPDAPQRQSVETRAYVFWEHEPEQDIAQTL